MMTPVVDVVMLGSAVVSTSCCLAAPERTTTRAQALAIAMPMAMAAAMMVDSMTVAWLGAAVLLMLSGSLFIGGRGVRLADLHRGLGGVLMAALVVGHAAIMAMTHGAQAEAHHHGTGIAMDQVMDHASPDHAAVGNAVVEHGAGTHALVLVLVAAAAAFIAWTIWQLVGMHSDPRRRLAMAEHTSMAISAGVMVIGVVLGVQAMHG